MKRNNLEALPTAVFQMVQYYSTEKNYLLLVNTSKRTFQDVKFETAQYSLNFGRPDQHSFERKLLQTTNKVKDKSKQISLSFEDVDDSVMVKYSWSFEGVAKLSVRGGITCDGFSIFRTVRHLILYNVNTELKVNLHLESTTRLRVSFCSFTEITAWNSKTLQEVSINCCSSLKSCPPLDTIPVVSISFCCSTLCNLADKLNSPAISILLKTVL
jgi:hypothetical protein